MSKKTRPKPPTAQLDEQIETVKLCPKSAVIVKHFQSQLQGGPPATERQFAQWFIELRDEYNSIEKLQQEINGSNWPNFVKTDRDMKTWKRAVHRARLAVMQVNVTLVATLISHRGCDPTVSNAIAKCVSSAQTSSGDDWKKLTPGRPVKKTRNPYEAERRAQVAALGMIYRTKADRQELYREAVSAGMSEREAKQVVRDAAAKKLKDPTFVSLMNTWKRYFEDTLAEAKRRGHVISIGQQIRTPYRPGPS